MPRFTLLTKRCLRIILRLSINLTGETKWENATTRIANVKIASAVTTASAAKTAAKEPATAATTANKRLNETPAGIARLFIAFSAFPTPQVQTPFSTDEIALPDLLHWITGLSGVFYRYGHRSTIPAISKRHSLFHKEAAVRNRCFSLL